MCAPIADSKICPHLAIVYGFCERGTAVDIFQSIVVYLEFWGVGDPLETLKYVFTKMISSEFLSPSSNYPTWRANFDWLFKNPDTWIKILEGQYDELFIKGRR